MGRSAAGGGLPGRSWHPGRETMATEFPFLKLYPFVLKKVMHLGFLVFFPLEIGASQCTSSSSWESISHVGMRSRRTVSCAREMVLCGRDLWFKCQCVTYLLCHLTWAVWAVHLTCFPSISLSGLCSWCQCGGLWLLCISTSLYRRFDDFTNAVPLRCQKRQELQLFLFIYFLSVMEMAMLVIGAPP